MQGSGYVVENISWHSAVWLVICIRLDRKHSETLWRPGKICAQIKLLLLHSYWNDYKDYNQGKIMYMLEAMKKSFRYSEKGLMKRKNHPLNAVCPKSKRKRNQQNYIKILGCKGVSIGTDGLWGNMQRAGVSYLQYSIFSVIFNSWVKHFHSTIICGIFYQAGALQKVHIRDKHRGNCSTGNSAQGKKDPAEMPSSPGSGFQILYKNEWRWSRAGVLEAGNCHEVNQRKAELSRLPPTMLKD